VYKAYHTKERKEVAVKIMHLTAETRIQNVENELYTMMLCKHPNLIGYNGGYMVDQDLWVLSPPSPMSLVPHTED
jgi:hypothetical protein